MRWPASKRKPSSRSSRLTWVKFVPDDQLLWLLSWLPGGVGLKYESEDKYVMDAEDSECYNDIKEQAEELMARPDAKHWTAEACSKRRRQALHGQLQVVVRS